MSVKLGLKPFSPDIRNLQLGKYLTGAPLPPHPAVFGHEALVQSWGMLANDRVGDCALAGAAHEHMLWCRIGGASAAFTDENVLSDYSALTGYNPASPDSDQGTDVNDLAKYRKKTGLIDAAGKRHRIGAYAFIDHTSLDQILEAIYLFGAVGFGFNVPQSAINQFDKGETWEVAPSWNWSGRKILGGHYVALVASRGTLAAVTWGKIQQMTTRFCQKYAMVAVAYLSEETVADDGISLEGFNLTQLREDLAQFA